MRTSSPVITPSRVTTSMDGTSTPSQPQATGVRGRRQMPLLRIRGPLALGWKLGLGAIGIVGIVAAWSLGAANSSKSVLPSPSAAWSALLDLQRSGVLADAVWASLQRVLIGYGISVAIGIVLGIAIGTFASIEAFFEAPIGFLRYIPASALTPLFLIWLGLGESPKIWLIVIGTVFYNILMIADVARAVPRELLDASYTLGAGRLTVLRRVILRHSVPGIIDVARINLAAAWLMLVVSEILAAKQGLAYQVIRAQRFRAVDKIFAVLIVFGLIGLLSDVLLRWLRNVSSPWARP